MLNITSNWRNSLSAIALVSLVAGCSRKAADERTAAGTLDSAALRTSSSAVTPAAGPGVQVTRTDEKSVQRSLEFELTADNFGKFLASADSVAALDGRDAATHAFLGNDITNSGSTDVDAGLKWIESNDSLSKAITSTGISVRDYYVMSLATAAAARFMDDPKAAPGTPTLAKNAEFLRSHKADLAHLQNLRDRKPVVTANP